ncbi:mandelate racemase/muconate lactonizing enzyme family protein [Cyclobacterium sp. 1_MG-2023]|uniref:mandelate racemase/muconate lactonizing enzyme family protein n=1 Tax=Cyclobacterium sp. 1_MG-2023 TaxID=3062681 RepID=UPI0026E4321A|nr:mandelate racemase/muconate lactonizing enzyme family protein [Cyclobacterium sp. 1_MG-2023]MDO6435907.1 mandelate racemase/muconate lactonizing enzyme family protein [Cyclobacterium sp. 1_MG-2023]
MTMKPKNNPKFKHLFDLPKNTGKVEKKSPHSSFVEENIPDRRTFLQKAALGGLGLGAFMSMPIEDTLAHSMQQVNRNSNPSDLRITDLRIAEVAGAPMRCPIIRIDTNQGIYGLGEVRDGASARYALVLKSRILGENPCQVERLFKKIKLFGNHARQAGGVCGIEMALWDLAGKAYNVPIYQMLGGKYRDSIRLYSDTTKSSDPEVFADRLKARKDKGYTFLKMDFGVEMVKDNEGSVVNTRAFEKGKAWDSEYGSYGRTGHPFTGVQITDKGIAEMVEYVAAVRNKVGYDIPLAADHFGHFDYKECIRLGEALEPYRLAWLEDMVPWFYTEKWKQITDAIKTPTLTGEDIFLKEEFIKLIDARAIDMIQPDLASSGGILETKKIGDYAEEKGIPMAMHFAGTPVSFMANIHCAAATENFISLEHHSVDIPWWEDMVKDIPKPLVIDGFAKVPEGPGLGIDLNEEVIKEHLQDGTEYFAPTEEWNTDRSNDRWWS